MIQNGQSTLVDANTRVPIDAQLSYQADENDCGDNFDEFSYSIVDAQNRATAPQTAKVQFVKCQPGQKVIPEGLVIAFAIIAGLAAAFAIFCIIAVAALRYAYLRLPVKKKKIMDYNCLCPQKSSRHSSSQPDLHGGHKFWCFIGSFLDILLSYFLLPKAYSRPMHQFSCGFSSHLMEFACSVCGLVAWPTFLSLPASLLKLGVFIRL